MLKKRSIAKIQLWAGLILFFLTIASSIFIVKEFYIGKLVQGVTSTTSTWGEIAQQINGTEIGLMGLVVSNVILQGEIMGATGYIFIACSIILVILSLMLILQGLYNLSKK
ncbi:MAG TPA: hypothetical protein VJI15_01790 [Candidatus Nanoarchaeia archaeon]|nr:hypothetical protein [Candidatus Nanoarchaeia archaeon]